MEYNKFGKLGFNISRFGVGCMRLPEIKGENGKPAINEDEAIKMIRYAVDKGVNYIDTAYPYHRGESEPLVGKALKDGYREKVKLATKLPTWLTNTYEDFGRYLDEQLEKLQTDHIDFYLLHALDKERWNKLMTLDVLRFMEDAKAKGKIRHIGFSFHDDLDTFKKIVDAYDWDMCQIMLNIIDQHYQAGIEGLHYAGAKGIPVVIMEPLKGGRLGQNIHQDIKDIWDSADKKLSPVEWAFKWVYNFPEVAVVLSGVSSMEQLQDNIRIFENAKPNTMTQKELELVDKVKKFYDSKIKVGCTECGYCQPCPQGVIIPDIFSLYNDIHIYERMEESSAFYNRIMKAEKDASKCVECGRCEAACPQQLTIIKFLKEAHAILNK